MRNPLNKRFKREFIRDIGKNLALFLFLTMTIAFSAGYLVAEDSLIGAFDASYEKYNIEHGHFVLSQPISKNLREDLSDAGVSVYELFYKNKENEKGHMVRIYKLRDEVNRTDIFEGKNPTSADEIAIDRLYAENNHIQVGDTMEIEGKTFTVSATVAFSDYTSLFRNNTDTMFDANEFTVALVTDEAFEAFNDAGLNYCYAYQFDEDDLSERQMKKKSDKLLDKLISLVVDENADSDPGMMIMMYLGYVPDKDEVLSIEDFVSRQDNQAIMFTREDFGSDSVMMQYMLYIVMAILAFIFSVTTRSNIEKEASAIGTLRASGYTRNELLAHYMVVPTTITLLSALIGNIAGYGGFYNYVADLYYHSYSLPPFHVIFSPDAFLKTTLVPCLIVILVNIIVLRRVLALPPLKFLRHELKMDKKRRRKALALKRGSFLHRFRTRVILQNKGAYITIFFGVLFANLLLAFGMLFVPLLNHYQEQVRSSMFADYQYVLKEKDETDNDAAEKYAMTSLENGTESVSIYGIEEDTRYLAALHMDEVFNGIGDKEHVIISSAYADKYHLREGDEIELYEKYGDEEYNFIVADIFDYPATISVYMPIGQFIKVFDLEEGDYTGYFSDEELSDVDEEAIVTIITEHELNIVAEQLNDSMGMIFPMFGAFAFALYLMVIYLLAKVVIERNEKSISMLKILGFKNSEAAGIYNVATGIVVVVSMLLSIPIIHLALIGIYAMLMLELSGYLSFYIAPWIYPGMMVIGIAGYLLVHLLQMRRIRRIPLAEALKDME